MWSKLAKQSGRCNVQYITMMTLAFWCKNMWQMNIYCRQNDNSGRMKKQRSSFCMWKKKFKIMRHNSKEKGYYHTNIIHLGSQTGKYQNTYPCYVQRHHQEHRLAINFLHRNTVQGKEATADIWNSWHKWRQQAYWMVSTNRDSRHTGRS